VVALLVRGGASADGLTVAGLGVSGVGGAALAAGAPTFTVAGVLTGRLLCDLLDGQVARASGRTTRAGAVLNDVSDGLGDVLLYGGLGIGTGSRALLVLAALGAATELVSVAVAAQGGPRSQAGPLAKVERMGMVALVGALGQLGVPTEVLYWLGCALAVLTLVRRLRAGLAALT
jgi:CDP-diacylglycerol--glycerol-3-phosphate 3-phosphatidyltransferase